MVSAPAASIGISRKRRRSGVAAPDPPISLPGLHAGPPGPEAHLLHQPHPRGAAASTVARYRSPWKVAGVAITPTTRLRVRAMAGLTAGSRPQDPASLGERRPQRAPGPRQRRVCAGHHEGLAALGAPGERHDLPVAEGLWTWHAALPTAVGHVGADRPGRGADSAGQLAHDLAPDAEAADAGIEQANRRRPVDACRRPHGCPPARAG
jgi:hypothetical protein